MTFSGIFTIVMYVLADSLPIDDYEDIHGGHTASKRRLYPQHVSLTTEDNQGHIIFPSMIFFSKFNL